MSDWNTKVIEEFRANEGRVGGPFEGANMILLHTVGAKSGLERVHPVVYFPEPDGAMIVVASKGGAPDNPSWYHNLVANPELDVEVGTRTLRVKAEELGPDERAVVWQRVVSEMPGFGDYEKRTDRVIPLIRLRPVA
ncbi:nitroreductase family deazaflavin-dependent oxidoreductase [Antribacter gilvus]|uniref:nitroreductase family deazaflavin-dependent oxidoreductase n=1 Tax=Antribacter gilvus TaxID=2304675 RepID=UPI000F76FDDA|nr:nitroreductase family deazaflavin-dependent oxidoreductase [Antribacter gilvus]